MYCRICANVRQDRCGGIYCCVNGGESVGLNQVCHIDSFELDNRVLEEVESLLSKDTPRLKEGK